MMIFRTTTLVAGMLALGATQALAWGDMYRGDGTTRAGETLVYPYPAAVNYCPAGLQPVVANGEICCGRPNTTATYYKTPSRTRSRAHQPRVYHIEGIKGAVYK